MMGGIHGASKRGNRRSLLRCAGDDERFSDRPTRWWNDRKLGAERIGSLPAGAALYAGTGPEMARKAQFRGAPRLTLTDSSWRPALIGCFFGRKLRRSRIISGTPLPVLPDFGRS